MFIARLFKTANIYRQPTVHQHMNKENVVYIQNKILFSLPKDGNYTICNKMDRSRRQYSKWNKSAVTEAVWFNNMWVDPFLWF